MAGLALVCAAAVLFRAPLATILTRTYLTGQGIRSTIVVDDIGFGGLTAHGALGDPQRPDLSFERLRVRFAPHRWIPEIGQIDIEHPTLRLTITGKGVSFGALDSLLVTRADTASVNGMPGFVSSDVSVRIRGARVLAGTPAGPVEIDADARSEGATLRRLDALVRPAVLRNRTVSARLDGGVLKVVPDGDGLRLQASFSGDLTANLPGGSIHLARSRLAIDASGLRWTGAAAAARQATLALDAASAGRQGIAPTPLSVRMQFGKVRAGSANGQMQSSGDVTVTAHGSLSREDARALVDAVPLLAADHRASSRLADAASDLSLQAQLAWQVSPEGTRIILEQPAQLDGAGHIALRLSPEQGGALRVSSAGMAASLGVSLSGTGIPNFAITVPQLAWRPTGGLDGTLAFDTMFDYGNYRGVALRGEADVRQRDGVLDVHLAHCADLRMAAIMSKRSRLASHAAIGVCPVTGEALFTAAAKGWTFRGVAKEGGANLDSAGLKLSGGSGTIAANGTLAGLKHAAVELAATLSDPAKARRIAPLAIAGGVKLDDAIATGRFDAVVHHTRIGSVRFVNHMGSGRGHADIDFRNIAFAPNALQPSDISPQLATLKAADGKASFAGSIDWTPKHVTSRGTFDVDDLQFTSPVGAAQRLRTHLIFTSLLPPATAPRQQVDIARVDWVSPLTKITTLFSLASSQLHVAEAKTDFASGSISLAPLSVGLTPGATVKSVVRLSHVALGTLINLSNLGNKIHLDGQVTGSIPFSFGPQGLRFASGHIEADGPGRLAIDPSFWGQSEANAVEKVAYKALADLAFEALSATIDSEPGGRLRIVFHIKGHSDSPGDGEIRLNPFDLINGTAFQKEIPLPRGTPIDLTLDTSLNFDELLRGYETAWSQAAAGGPQKEQP